jgi:ribonuclease-3
MWNFFRRATPLEKTINYKFKNIELLNEARTHHSFYKKTKDNEVLEFLGDSVLGLCVATILMNRLTDYNEGILTRKKILITNNKFLSNTVKFLKIEKYLIKNGKVEPSEYMLADFFEAILGAIYFDRGFSAALKQTEWFYDNVWAKMDTSSKDYKSKLQSYCQKNYKSLPTYKTFKVRDKKKPFKGVVTFKNGSEKKFVAYSKTKKLSEQYAAKKALFYLRTNVDLL